MTRRRQKKRAHRDESPREERSRGVRKAGILFASVVLLSASLAAGLLLSGVVTGGSSGAKTAAIVNQLSLSQPNQDFVASATNLLEQAGYRVDYFPGEEVTVQLYRDLPSHDYGLIILRVHSGISEETDLTTGEKTKKEYVSLFTGEPYRRGKYPEEEIGQLGRAEYYEGAPPLFGIGPGFITDSMRGSFDETLIIMMGCDGLRSQTTAQAFLDKGASAFVSWSRSVSASHTDAATELLLQKLLIDGLPVGEAVAQTATEIGPDPAYGARLRVLPEGGPTD